VTAWLAANLHSWSAVSIAPLPHLYSAAASASLASDVWIDTPGTTAIRTASPAEFGGTGVHWSPEALLVGAVADCFVLTFRAVAGPSKLRWQKVTCAVTGTLDRVEGGLEFIWLRARVNLTIADSADTLRARRLVEKADHACLIARSLKAPVELEVLIDAAPSLPANHLPVEAVPS